MFHSQQCFPLISSRQLYKKLDPIIRRMILPYHRQFLPLLYLWSSPDFQRIAYKCKRLLGATLAVDIHLIKHRTLVEALLPDRKAVLTL
jgi:hypothetical protein